MKFTRIHNVAQPTLCVRLYMRFELHVTSHIVPPLNAPMRHVLQIFIVGYKIETETFCERARWLKRIARMISMEWISSNVDSTPHFCIEPMAH